MEKLEEQIENTLSRVEVDIKWIDYCLKVLRRYSKENSNALSRQKSIIQKQYNENEAKIMNITEKYSLGKIDDDIYIQMIKQCKKRRFDLEEKLNVFGKQHNLVVEDFIKDIHIAKKIAKRFKNGTITEKKEIMQNLQSNLWLVNGNLMIDLKSSFLFLSQTSRLQSTIEPRKNRSTKGQNGLSESNILRWCTFSDVIRTYLKIRVWIRANEII